MASPFFLMLLIDWQMFPDQSKYISGSRFFRKVMYDPQNLIEFLEDKVSRKVNISSIFYGLFPFVNFETYKSIGFINRFLYLFIIFLSFKKYSFKFKVVFNFQSIINNVFINKFKRDINFICDGFFDIFLIIQKIF